MAETNDTGIVINQYRDNTHVGDIQNAVDNFIPSKGRDIKGTVYAGAAQNQPSGRALTSLILGEWHNAEDHVRAAMHINPFAELINSALSAEVKHAIRFCATNPTETIQRREKDFYTIEQLSRRLNPQKSRWTSRLPNDSPARNIHFPLIFALTTILDFEDTEFVKDLSNGMPIAGPIAPTPGLTTRKRDAQMSYQEWKRGIPKRNCDVIERVSKTQGTTLANACWEKTLKEVTAGWVTEPRDLTDEIAGILPLTPRYAIQEQHGLQESKIRMIDDFRASAVNAIVSTDDTNIPENLDVFAAIACYTKLVAPGCEVLCATLDFAHAYKHVPIHEDQKEFATILLAPPAGPLKVATLRTQPFGSKRAPANWSRVTNFAKWLLLKVFRIVISVYVDDIFLIETAGTVNSAFQTIKSVCNLLGFVLEDAKEQPPSSKLVLLGAEVSIFDEIVTARLPERKRCEILNELRQFIAKKSVTPAQAAKMKGRLGHSQSLMFGRYGRALLTEFSSRQYSKNQTKFHPINDDLAETINWWIGILCSSAPRKICLLPKKPLLAYADASGPGHLGVVIFCEGSSKSMHTHLPGWFVEESGIYEFEIAAMIYALLAASLLMPGRPLLLCGDNSGAVAAIVRGNCTTKAGKMLTAVFWAIAAFYGTPIWVEEVRSKFNIADLPSRACPLLEEPFSFKKPNFGVPESFKYIFDSLKNLGEARYKFTEQGLAFTGPWACQNSEPCQEN